MVVVMDGSRVPSGVASGVVEAAPRVLIEGVGRTFVASAGEVEALREVNMTIPDGQFCCQVGPSGCGKTTLLRIVAGLSNPSRGRVVVRHDDAARQARAVVFQ